jgi:two-component system sensor histidine kinase PhoQ
MSGLAGFSLQARLLLAGSILLAVFLGLTGVVLDRAFRSSVEAGVAEQLQVQIYVLLAAAEETDGQFYFYENIREPRFTQLNSNLFGFISSAEEGALLRTPSALEVDFDGLGLAHDLARGETRFARSASIYGMEYFVSSYAVTWENRPDPIVFSVLESTQTYLAEVGKFRASLWSWLGGLAVLLLVLQLVLLRWGLSPLRRLAKDLKRIESGVSDALGSDYPTELQSVTQNLNLLIQTERKQQSRYRTTLGDLAHSLKTPLAVIQGEMANWVNRDVGSGTQNSSAELIQEQLQHMNQIVGYQLQRAVRSGSANTLARQVNVAEAVSKLGRALEKVYAAKHVVIGQDIAPTLSFVGDERDLLEVLGNLLDNACKYGNGDVRIRAWVENTVPPLMYLQVDDNGPGISAQDAERVLQRGVRLDTLAQGQGIGLAVLADIVGSYGGTIMVGNSSLGGASVTLGFSNMRQTD